MLTQGGEHGIFRRNEAQAVRRGRLGQCLRGRLRGPLARVRELGFGK